MNSTPWRCTNPNNNLSSSFFPQNESRKNLEKKTKNYKRTIITRRVKNILAFKCKVFLPCVILETDIETKYSLEKDSLNFTLLFFLTSVSEQKLRKHDLDLLLRKEKIRIISWMNGYILLGKKSPLLNCFFLF